MEINKIKVQNVDFDIRDISATKTVELTQAEYDALATKDPNTLYIITDATGGDLSDYYNKDEIDDLLDEVESVAAAALNDLEERKLDASAYTPTDLSNYYNKTEVNGLLDDKLDASAYTPTDLTNYYNKTEVNGLLANKVDTTAFSTYSAATEARLAEDEEVTAAALNNLEEKKLDASAYTPTDLSNYYTKSETSGATEISTALANKADTATTYTKTEVDNAITAGTSTKQDTLVSGTNIKTINNESILGSGNIDIQGGGGGVDVVQTTGTSTTDVMSQNAVTNIQQNVIAQYSNSYDGQGRTGVWAQKTNGNSDDNLSIFATKINGRDVIAGGYSNRTRISVNLSLVETSAITTSMSSSSTDSQVPSAKAVYDQFGGLKLVKLTQSEYDALSTKDANTLYIIV